MGGSCRCEEGWTGAACDQRVCNPLCVKHGTCKDGKCECEQGWNGEHCTIGRHSPSHDQGTDLFLHPILTITTDAKALYLLYLYWSFEHYLESLLFMCLQLNVRGTCFWIIHVGPRATILSTSQILGKGLELRLGSKQCSLIFWPILWFGPGVSTLAPRGTLSSRVWLQLTCLEVCNMPTKTLISWVRCVLLGSELNSRGQWPS